jgi:predicted unusual protein kinase regulating ubiquinone biosynthesis (AarF/ABC1/UbiB family)
VTEIPGDILLIFRVIGLMSGLQKHLDSDVNMVQTIGPYAEQQAANIVDFSGSEAAAS